MDSQKLLSYLRQTIEKYNMIEEGDKIAVGLSGGKDSLTLLYGLSKLQKFYPKYFELVAIYVHLGIHDIESVDTDDLKYTVSKYSEITSNMTSFCDSIGVPFYQVDTEIYDIVFTKRNEKNPCSLCAKLRKGALNNKAIELGANKVALAHNQDDFIETSLMSLFQEGHYYCFPPITTLPDKTLTFIRPMLMISEQEISGFARRNQFPITKNACPMDGNSKRQVMKEFIEESKETFPGIRKNLISALNEYFDNNM